MATAPEPATPATAPELVITRVFDAPRDVVWRAWTDPNQVRRWWGPKDYTAPACTLDLRVGGRYHFCMRSPDGQDYWSTGTYREIVAPERLVYTDSFADAQGNVVPASHYGMPGDWPLAMQVTVTLEDQGDRTRMTLRHAGLPAGEMAEATGAGWNESFDKFAAALARRLIVTLPSDREIQMTRVFDAPRRLVFEAHTSVEHMRHWWGPRGFTMVTGAMDFRPGGAWRFVLRKPDGREYAFRGEFREIVPPERIVWTFEFEAAPGEVAVETLTLVERDGKTTLTTRSVAASREARDAVLQSGMEAGAAETWDRLEEYVGTLHTADREIVLTRVVDAPRELVFDVWLDPQHIGQWWGPNGFTTTTHEMDVRPGGVWRFTMHGPDGTDYENKIVYLAIARPERLVYRHSGEEGTEDVRFHTTVTFATEGAKTRVTLRSLFESADERTRVVEKYGAIEGGEQTLARLAAYVATQGGRAGASAGAPRRVRRG